MPSSLPNNFKIVRKPVFLILGVGEACLSKKATADIDQIIQAFTDVSENFSADEGCSGTNAYQESL